MKASEILRKLADIIDSKEETGSTEIMNQPEVVDVEEPTTTSGIEGQAQVNTKSMVGPLQQKLELMKKLAGEEDICPECNASPCECGHEEMGMDPLAIIKQNAGLAPFVTLVADEDEPFES